MTVLELGSIAISKQVITIARTGLIRGPRFLALSVSLSPMTLLNLLYMYHQPTKVHVIIKYVFPTLLSETPVIDQLISSLLLDTREEAYLESIQNFKENSLTQVPFYHKLMNSSTIASLCSLGKNLSKNVVLRTSKVIGTSPGYPLPRHILCHSIATSLS